MNPRRSRFKQNRQQVQVCQFGKDLFKNREQTFFRRPSWKSKSRKNRSQQRPCRLL
jgi:hypothetical protein